MESVTDIIGRAVRQRSLVSGDDTDGAVFGRQLSEIESLVSDIKHDIL